MDIASTSNAPTESVEVDQIKTECTNTESKDVSLPVNADKSTDLLCPICSQYFFEPKILDCLHNICRPCLEKGALNHEDGRNSISCPVCDVETSTLNGLIGLMNNTTLRGLVEEAILADKISGDVSKITCQACVDDSTAVSRCMDCDNFLCSECQNAHQRLIALKHHIIVPMADLKSGKVTFKSKLRDATGKCSKHSDQNICFFCVTCQMLICITCTVLDHCRVDHHTYTKIETAIDCCRSEIKKLVAEAEKSKKSFQDAETLTVEAESRLKTFTKKAERDISAKADREVAKIRNKEKQLKVMIQRVYNKRVARLEGVQLSNGKKVTMAKQNLKKIGKIMSQASRSEILSLKPKIANQLKDLISTKHDSVPYSLSYVNFKESKSNKKLGQILTSEKWELKTKLGEGVESNTQFDDLFHVAPFPSGKLLIFDRGRNQLMIFSDANEQLKALPDELGHLNFSTAIAVVSEDRIVFTSNSVEKKVRMIDVGPANSVLFDVTPWTDAEELTSLTAVEGNMIAVGDKGKGRIGLLDETGSLLKTLPADNIGHYLTFSRAHKHLIYTDYESGRLIAMDLNSNLVFSVETLNTSGNRVFPTGVCCDDQGEIYVAVQKSKSRSGKDEIYHYTPEGIFAQTKIKDLFDVYGITFNNDDSLVVADCHSLKTFHVTNKGDQLQAISRN